MMPEVSIYYLMAIFRVFLLIIGQKQNFSVIASTKNDIDMKCHDSLKPLCALYRGGAGSFSKASPTLKFHPIFDIWPLFLWITTLKTRQNWPDVKTKASPGAGLAGRPHYPCSSIDAPNGLIFHEIIISSI